MTVLLTGATGFLGSRLLLSLLTTRNRDVTVLGRGTPSVVRSRVLAALASITPHGIDAQARARLRCVAGDISKPWLGLTPAMYGRLAEETAAIWHCAGDIALSGERERLFRANVQGTLHVLEFAEITPPACRLVHVSTVAVAGARTSGTVAEADLTDAYGFTTHYDESKYQGEILVREWARRLGRPAVVLRPGIVASDARLPEGAPGHPLKVLGEMIEAVARGGAPGIPAVHEHGEVLPIRLRVPADATFNIVQDRYATEAMLRVGHDAGHDRPGVRTFHIVHPAHTPMRAITQAVQAQYPNLRIDCAELIPDPTAAERFVGGHLPGFLNYCHHTRSYDRSGATALTGDLEDPAPIDLGYLTRALGFHSASAHALPRARRQTEPPQTYRRPSPA
ncbi:SDR family oxidoreductase [Streptomyces sp. NPDC006978]|uniref:SDR family oxidoreductase n=1 Tax=unclassified Streptomyces TaxID=2593676 RepID=UPI002B0023AE|nr:SDR family oxidoreductase [Streptomyces sp. S584]